MRQDVSYKGMSNRSIRIIDLNRLQYSCVCTLYIFCSALYVMSNKLSTVLNVCFIHAGMFAPGLTKGKRFYKPPAGGRRWRPGTQALQEIRHEMWSTRLCIPRLPFLWYVHYISVQLVCL